MPLFKTRASIKNKRNLREKYELCQLIRDILSVNESTNWNLKPSIKSKYSSIGAYIQPLARDSDEYLDIKNDIINSKSDLRISNIYAILRPSEHISFKSNLKNLKLLYHGSKTSNYLGILSRGLLMPKYVAKELGDEMRSDIGLLGQGIYFSDSTRLSIGYTNASRLTNTRLLAVCEVALGEIKDYFDYDCLLTQAPDGYQSVRGVKSSEDVESKFIENEYVVYDARQCQIKYLVEFECAPFREIDNESNSTESFAETSMSVETPIDLEGIKIFNRDYSLFKMSISFILKDFNKRSNLG